jgi:hypothetical protein
MEPNREMDNVRTYGRGKHLNTWEIYHGNKRKQKSKLYGL